MGKERKKTICFVFFILSVFYSLMVIFAFSDFVPMLVSAGCVLLIGSLLFATQCLYVSEPKENDTKGTAASNPEEIARTIEKSEKSVAIAVKRQNELTETGFAMLEERLNDLLQAQENAAKTVILFNKENAKQVATNEKAELQKLGEQFKSGMDEFQTSANEKLSEITELMSTHSQKTNKANKKNSDANATLLNEISERLTEIRSAIRSLNTEGQKATDLSGVTLLLNQVVTLLMNGNPAPRYQASPEPEPVIKPQVNSDPIEITPEPIEAEPEKEPEPAAEEQQQTIEPQPTAIPQSITEPQPTPEVEPEPAADPLASSGVDLSDPNRALSADDIAALFASMNQ